ncbi:hypothetical protein G6F36_012808 [Rhizopus arrhizus]|nr:hypothetical protein G6F36_012808 [Rhizopus arrhizus]
MPKKHQRKLTGDVNWERILADAKTQQTFLVNSSKVLRSSGIYVSRELIESMNSEGDNVEDTSNDDRETTTDLISDFDSTPPLERQESFESDHYHPGRKYLHIYEDEPTWPDIADGNEWIIEDINISNELKQFKKASSQINTNQGNMNDMRILALHLIFPFMLSANSSITKYMGSQTRKLVEKDIESLYEAPPTTTTNLLLWCEKLRTMKLDWFRMKNECRNIMNKAHETGDDHEVLASYILFDIVPQLTKYVDDDEKGEDTFIKNYLECFLTNIFSIEESMYQSWANVVLNNKNDDQVKPDWIAYVKPWFKKFNIIACEVKPPSKVGRGDISDYVKLGIEMKDMLNGIMDARVASASVLGILVEGK